MGPEAKTAIFVLRKFIEQDQDDFMHPAETIAALYQLAPDGKEVAEKWLGKPLGRPERGDWHLFGQHTLDEVEGRALVLGVMGRTSVEADCVIRHELEWLDWVFSHDDPRRREPDMYLGERLESLGRFGVGGRLAIPRLKELCQHPNPWVRVHADEALTRIMPKDDSMKVPSRSTAPRTSGDMRYAPLFRFLAVFLIDGHKEH